MCLLQLLQTSLNFSAYVVTENIGRGSNIQKKVHVFGHSFIVIVDHQGIGEVFFSENLMFEKKLHKNPSSFSVIFYFQKITHHSRYMLSVLAETLSLKSKAKECFRSVCDHENELISWFDNVIMPSPASNAHAQRSSQFTMCVHCVHSNTSSQRVVCHMKTENGSITVKHQSAMVSFGESPNHEHGHCSTQLSSVFIHCFLPLTTSGSNKCPMSCF